MICHVGPCMVLHPHDWMAVYVVQFFPGRQHLEYAVRVEEYTLAKAANLVMNVDGCIAALFLDLLSSSGSFTQKEIDEIINIGYLNGLFVLARSIGLIGESSRQSQYQLCSLQLLLPVQPSACDSY